MRYWQTRDGPTNANLSYLETLAKSWPGISRDQFMEKLRAVIGLQRVLPQTVRRHFSLPYLFIGNEAERWSDARLQEKAEELCESLESGLAAAHDDPSLGRDGDADWSDRPATRGEEIVAAEKAFAETRSGTDLANLRAACAGTPAGRAFDALERWLKRRRSTDPHRTVEYEIVCALSDIRDRAESCHYIEATYRFSNGSMARVDRR